MLAITWAVAASAAGVAIGFAVQDPRVEGASLTPEPAATLVALEGVVHGPGGAALAQGGDLPDGAAVQTEADGRAALRLAGGAMMRMNLSTRTTLDRPGALVLAGGEIYLDSGPVEGGALEVRTAGVLIEGSLCRFQVAASRREIQVSVRQGSILIRRAGNEKELHAGDRMTIGVDGTARIEPTATFGPAWDWIYEVAPRFDMEGRTLGEFLDWLSAETGLLVRLAEGSNNIEITGIVLHGSIAGVRPDRTPDAVLPACGLAHRLEGGVLEIEPAMTARGSR